MDGNARQKMMQAIVAAPCGWAEERYEVDYEGKREENLAGGLWWGMVERIQLKINLLTSLY